jgi:prepilin-type N-terminal cleavage/methylation domain-containing protein
MNLKSRKKGVTLIELAIVLALFSLSAVLAVNFVNFNTRVSKETNINSLLESEASIVTANVEKKIMEAKDIKSIELSATSKKIIFEYKDTTPNYELTITGKELSGGGKVLSNNVKSMALKNVDSTKVSDGAYLKTLNNIQLEITFEKDIITYPKGTPLNINVTFRNWEK